MEMNEKKMLEAAAKACGFGNGPFDFSPRTGWNPLTNGLDTAEMCVKLGINCMYHNKSVACGRPPNAMASALLADHDNSRLKAWMHAATMVAAKIEGYEE